MKRMMDDGRWTTRRRTTRTTDKDDGREEDDGQQGDNGQQGGRQKMKTEEDD